MFRLLNIHALLSLDFESQASGASAWRLSALDLSSGSQAGSGAWQVVLAAREKEISVRWPSFLREFRVAGAGKESVGEMMTRLLADLESRAKDRKRMRALVRELIAGRGASHAVNSLLGDDPVLALWFQGGLTHSASDLLAPTDLGKNILAGIADDRKLLDGAPAASAEAAAKTVQLALKPLSPAADSGFSEFGFAQRVEHSAAGCRTLLTLSERSNSPASVESVIFTILRGALEAVIDEACRPFFLDQSVEVSVRLNDTGWVDQLAGRRYAAVWEAQLPVWSLREKLKVKVEANVGIEPGSKSDRKPLEDILSRVSAAMSQWAAGRASPLASGGDGWIGLLEQVTWDDQMFARWINSSSLAEKVSRLALIERPPTSREKMEGWRALLSRIADERAALDLNGWHVVIEKIVLWDADRRASFKEALLRKTLDRISAKEASEDELAGWLDLWRRSCGPDAPDSKGAEAALMALIRRCESAAGGADARLAVDWWVKSGKSAHWSSALARALLAAPQPEPGLVNEVKSAFSPADERLAAYEAVDACVRDVAPAETKLPLQLLAQSESASARWKLDEPVRRRISELMDLWAKRLDGSQQHGAWKDFVVRRNAMKRMGLVSDPLDRS